MTALAANAPRQTRNDSGKTELEGLIATSSVIFDGAFVVKTATGTLKPASNTAAEYFHGMAVIENPQSAGPGITGDGTLRVKTVSNLDVLCAIEAGLTAADVGKALWCQDDNTMGTTTSNGPKACVLVEFITEAASWVRLGAPALDVSP